VSIIQVPKVFHEVFGESQTRLEVSLRLVFAVLGCCFLYAFHLPRNADVSGLFLILGFILIGDILAGCIANFTRGTNNYYANRLNSRWVFIAIHFHIIAIAWLLDGSLMKSAIVWGFTITSAIIVNLLNNNQHQLFIAANLVCLGILLISILDMPMLFMIVSLFFIIKVVLSFAVNHYPN